MSSYHVDAVTLQSMVDDTTSAITAFDLFGGQVGLFAFGEYMKLSITFTKASPPNFHIGQYFVFNPCLFAQAQYVAPLQIGYGWQIRIADYTGAGVFEISLQAGSPAASLTQRNTRLTATRITDTQMRLDFYFYASQDIFGYISSAIRSNTQTLLYTGLGTPDLDNSPDSAYRRAASYLEFLLYESDALLAPVTVGDPYTRDLSTPASSAQKSCSYEVAGSFVDNTIGATNAWSGGVLTENALKNVNISVSAYKFGNFLRKGDPFLSNKSDENFEITSFDGLEAPFSKDSPNLVFLSINRAGGTFTPNKVVVRLWRMDALASTQPFYVEYELRTADLPAADATAYPNAISGTPVFSTPASWSATVSTIDVSFYINGTQLVADAEYRVWVGLYSNTGPKATTHLTPPITVISDGRSGSSTLTFIGNTQTFEYEYVGSNDVELAIFQRFRPMMTAQAATYTGGASLFASQLRRVVCQYVELGSNRIVAKSQYDFLNDVSITTGQDQQGRDPVMRKTVVGTNYTFDTILRVPFSSLAFPTATEARWLFILQTPSQNGGTNTLSISATQTIRRKGINLIEIPSISFLDYAQYQLGTKVPIDVFCEDVEKYVVWVQIDAYPPDRNLTALVVYGNPDGTETILEENGFTPTYLPLEQAQPLELVPPDFGALDQFFVLDISLLPSRAENITVWAITQEI